MCPKWSGGLNAIQNRQFVDIDLRDRGGLRFVFLRSTLGCGDCGSRFDGVYSDDLDYWSSFFKDAGQSLFHWRHKLGMRISSHRNLLSVYVSIQHRYGHCQ